MIYQNGRNADNEIVGSRELLRVYCGNRIIWQRSDPDPVDQTRITIIMLDSTTLLPTGQVYYVDTIAEIVPYKDYGLHKVVIGSQAGITRIENSALASEYGLVEIVIPSSVLSIGTMAFQYCNELRTVTIAQGITAIADRTFEQCTNLSTVTIPQGVTSIGIRAFYNCQWLKTAEMPESVAAIGQYAFYNCRGLENIHFTSRITRIEDYAFSNCVLALWNNGTEIILPDTVTYVGRYAFSSMWKITRMHFPDTITSLLGTFDDCHNLIEANIPTYLSAWGSLQNCYKLTSLVFPSYVENFSCSFTFCNDLATLQLPSSIGSASSKSAFINGVSVSELRIPQGVKYATIGYDYNLTTVYFPSSITEIDFSTIGNIPRLRTIYIDKPENSISGAPWGARNATVIWTG